MSTSVELLEAEALQLTAAERARLVERLITSLDADPEIEDAWAAEVERRHAQNVLRSRRASRGAQ